MAIQPRVKRVGWLREFPPSQQFCVTSHFGHRIAQRCPVGAEAPVAAVTENMIWVATRGDLRG